MTAWSGVHSGWALPVTNTVVTLTERDGGRTLMAINSQFPSLEAMEQLIAMGMDEGMKEALSQIDAILAASPAV